MGRIHILPEGYHWMEPGHEERDLKIIDAIVTFLLTGGMLIFAYYFFNF